MPRIGSQLKMRWHQLRKMSRSTGNRYPGTVVEWIVEIGADVDADEEPDAARAGTTTPTKKRR